MDKDFLKDFHFTPDGATSLADALCAFIKDEIAYGRLKAGEPIPTIQDLAEASGLTFRVARGVVEQLAREGYVRSRPRVGTVVLSRDIRAVRGRVLFALPDVDASSYHATQIADAGFLSVDGIVGEDEASFIAATGLDEVTAKGVYAAAQAVAKLIAGEGEVE